MSSVALRDDSGIVAEYTHCQKVTHSERLLPLIQRILEETALTISEVAAVAISVGPGSFTSIRVAVSTAKGLACSQQKPVIPVSSLLGLARHFVGTRRPICTLLDARKGEVYAGLYHNSDGGVESLAPEQVVSPEQLCEEIVEPTLFVGEGAIKYRCLIEELLPSYANFVPGPLNLLSAAAVAEIGYEQFQAGQAISPDGLVPNYIRRSEAEMRWKKRP